MPDLCAKCGKCCWNWKENNPADKCRHLAGDMKTCLVYGLEPKPPTACGGIGAHWPQPYHACDLPDDCGYVLYWRGQETI